MSMLNNVTAYLDRIVKLYPSKTAYIDANHEMSFGEIKDKAYQVASEIIRHDVHRKPIMVFMNKSAKEIACFFGVAYSSNYYTPLDTKMPKERLKRIVDTLRPSLIISDEENEVLANEIFPGIDILTYEKIEKGTVLNESIETRKSGVIDTDLLYVMFTSGSTGIPKGVTISHRAVINYIEWVCDDFDIDEATVLGNEAPLYFDLSIQDVYAPLKSGCTTVLIDKNRFSFPSSLMRYLSDMKVNCIVWVPSALSLIADMKGLKSKELPELKRVMFCGEVMPTSKLNMWREAFPNAKFVNLYGPTEACDACMYYPIERKFENNESLPIGFAAPNTDVFLLDEEGHRIEECEVKGEICLRGSALSYGYYNDNEKTVMAFEQNPYIDSYGEKIYRTGDIGKYNHFGEMEYVSRKDYQIKHLGHRIELMEIESAALSNKDVRGACCLYDKTNQHIVLFFEGNIEGVIVKDYLLDYLPSYMMPALYEKLDQIPRTANGKVDRGSVLKIYEKSCDRTE